jgi:competence protein ComEA
MEGWRGYSTAIAVGFVLIALSVLGFKWHGLNERAAAATPAALYSYAPPKRDAVNKGGASAPQAPPQKSRGVSPNKPPAKPAAVQVATPKSSPKKSAAKALPALRSININTATQAQLEALPGIGPALASRIVSYRNQHGRFASVDALDEVKGIGPKKLADIAPYCYVE